MNNFTSRQALTLIGVTMIGVLLAVILKGPLVLGFLPGYLFLVFLCKNKGSSYAQITMISLKGVLKARIVILILLFVSFLLPSWHTAGTIEQMVRIALQFINPEYFLLLSFLFAMLFSMILGTSVGTLSSIGIPIMSTALILNLPVEMVAGALVSGAFVGDRTSPFSSSHQLLATTIEIPVTKQFQSMLPTTFFAIALTSIFFIVLDGFFIQPSLTSIPNEGALELSFLKFVPPILLLLLVVFRVKIVFAFLWSIVSALLISFLGNASTVGIFTSLWYGIDGLGGGLKNMYLLLLFLALAGAYNGLVEEFHVIKPLLETWMKPPWSLTGDTVRTITATLAISFVSANQTLPIILTGRSFLPHWKERYSKLELARVMSDSTMLFPGMIPWSVLAIMCSTIVGVPLLDYLPYAVFLWILPILTIILSTYKEKNPSTNNQMFIIS